MILPLIGSVVVSSLIVAAIGYSYTQRDAMSRISEEEEDQLSGLNVYIVFPAIALWGLVTEVFTWTKIGVKLFLSPEYREFILDEDFIFINEDEE